jgi:hypothetical protein
MVVFRTKETCKWSLLLLLLLLLFFNENLACTSLVMSGCRIARALVIIASGTERRGWTNTRCAHTRHGGNPPETRRLLLMRHLVLTDWTYIDSDTSEATE